MTAGSAPSRIPVEEMAEQCRAGMIPLNTKFSYFAGLPVSEEDIKQYLEDPIAALPTAVVSALPAVGVLLVPYLEKGDGKTGDAVVFEPPGEHRLLYAAEVDLDDRLVLAFTIKEEDTAHYHYTLFHTLAGVITRDWGGEGQDVYYRVLREELGAGVHGEVEEQSWHLKQALVRRQKNVRKETKLFREYARQSFIDTMTLYLHGICCDIDIETGPRQMPSRYLRRRLEQLYAVYPPPPGYAVFPEQVNR